MTPLVLRPARAEDAKAVARLASSAEVSGWGEASVEAERTRPITELWVAEDAGGRLQGFALAHVIASEVDLLLIAVSAGARRRGVGRRLLSALLEAAAPVEAVHLEVAQDNTAARCFYAHLGFEETGRRAGYYGSGRDAIMMRLAGPPDVDCG